MCQRVCQWLKLIKHLNSDFPLYFPLSYSFKVRKITFLFTVSQHHTHIYVLILTFHQSHINHISPATLNCRQRLCFLPQSVLTVTLQTVDCSRRNWRSLTFLVVGDVCVAVIRSGAVDTSCSTSQTQSSLTGNVACCRFQAQRISVRNKDIFNTVHWVRLIIMPNVHWLVVGTVTRFSLHILLLLFKLLSDADKLLCFCWLFEGSN